MLSDDRELDMNSLHEAANKKRECRDRDRSGSPELYDICTGKAAAILLSVMGLRILVTNLGHAVTASVSCPWT